MIEAPPRQNVTDQVTSTDLLRVIKQQNDTIIREQCETNRYLAIATSRLSGIHLWVQIIGWATILGILLGGLAVIA